MAGPEIRHEYLTLNHKPEGLTFPNAAARIAGSGLTLPSGTPYTLAAIDVGRWAYQTDAQTFWRLMSIGPLVWMQVGAGAASVSTLTAQNKDGTTLAAGMPAARHSSGTGVVHGDATGAAKQAVGLAAADIAAGISGNVQTGGLLQLADWTAVTGTVTLAALGLYYLSTTPGLLTTTAPSTVGNVVQLVGKAVSPDTMEIICAQGILL